MLISKASFNVNTLVVVVVHFTVTLSQQREHWIPYALCNRISEPFTGAAGECFQSADFDRDLYFLPLFIEIENNSASPFHSSVFCCCFFLLQHSHKPASLIVSLAAVFAFRWRKLACCGCRVYVYFITFFSKLFNAGICADTHTLKDPSGSRLLLFSGTAKFTLLSRKCTTHHFGLEEYLILFVSQL